jgi:hypothetical protein
VSRRIRTSAVARDVDQARASRSQHVDELMDAYVSWRETCVAVARSYESWGRADRRLKQLAFDAYVVALDREQEAAAAYQQAAAQLAA